MDTPPGDDDRTALATETRLSAMLIVGALGSMGLLAITLLMLSNWLAG